MQTFHLLLFIVTVMLNFMSAVVGHATYSGLTFELPDNEQMCFLEDFEGSQAFVLEFRVISGGSYDVDVSFETPTGAFLYKATRIERDSIKFETGWGTYKLCFSNEFSSITHKIIYFHLRPEEHDQLGMEAGRGPGANTLLEASTETIHSSLTHVMHYQTQYRLNESKGRNGADVLNHHVQLWSIVQGVIILVTGFGQAIILKRFFTDKRESAITALAKHHETSGIHVPPMRV